MPRPAAKAKGKRVTRPNSSVITPAVSAVVAATCVNPSVSPATSVPLDRMTGFRMTISAIVTKVPTPQRISAGWSIPLGDLRSETLVAPAPT